MVRGAEDIDEDGDKITWILSPIWIIINRFSYHGALRHLCARHGSCSHPEGMKERTASPYCSYYDLMTTILKDWRTSLLPVE